MGTRHIPPIKFSGRSSHLRPVLSYPSLETAKAQANDPTLPHQRGGDGNSIPRNLSPHPSAFAYVEPRPPPPSAASRVETSSEGLHSHPQVSMRTLPAQVPFCQIRAHLFPFPEENQRSAGLSGTERSSRGSPPSPASRNSAKGGGAPRSDPTGASQPGQAWCTVLSGAANRALQWICAEGRLVLTRRSGPQGQGPAGKPLSVSRLLAPLPRVAAEDPQRLAL